LKKLILICIAAWFLCACSSSDPSIMNFSASDSNPVTGQKVLLQLRGLTDHYPMTYSWQADSGTLDAWTSEDNFVYWTAPDTPGNSRITCTVIDKDDNTTVQTFDLNVSARAVEVLYPTGSGDKALYMKKEVNSIIGGVWLSLNNSEIRYIDSTSDTASTWTGAYGAMYVAFSSLSLSHALWGAPSPGNVIYEQSSSGTSSVTCPTCPTDDVIHALEVSLADPGFFLMIGSNTGLHWYYTTTEGLETWHDFSIGVTNGFFTSSDGTIIYAASEQGIFELPYPNFIPPSTPLYAGDSCAVMQDGALALWHVTGGQVCKDGVVLGSQPPRVACSLDIDRNGSIWCGKYYWDGSSWQSPQALDLFAVDAVAATSEGIMYFITDSGAFLRY
jgi:hypothetical protein